MKKCELVLGTTVVVFSSVVVLGHANAASINGDNNSSVKDTESALILPAGGYLHGSMSGTDPLTGKTITYNSDTDPHATTVGAIQNKTNAADSYYYQINTPIALQDSSASPTPLTRSAYPNARPWVLGAEASYTSNYFSGKGWCFAGYTFSAKSGTGGPYLLWQSLVDSGRVGSYAQANQTAMTGSGNYAQGTAISKNQLLRIAGPSTYYTWSPLNGTRYSVANR